MSEPYIGEIRIFAGNFAPRGWALCNGQLMSITQNSTLFSILGVQYGGDGRITFALPNLMARVPIGTGDGPGLTSRLTGELGGSASVNLATTEMPVHIHTGMGYAGNGTTNNPTGAVWAQYSTTTRPPTRELLYGTASDLMQMSPMSLGATGGSQPHNNMQPYLGLTFIIALEGIFPPRS